MRLQMGWGPHSRSRFLIPALPSCPPQGAVETVAQGGLGQGCVLAGSPGWAAAAAWEAESQLQVNWDSLVLRLLQALENEGCQLHVAVF